MPAGASITEAYTAAGTAIASRPSTDTATAIATVALWMPISIAHAVDCARWPRGSAVRNSPL